MLQLIIEISISKLGSYGLTIGRKSHDQGGLYRRQTLYLSPKVISQRDKQSNRNQMTYNHIRSWTHLRLHLRGSGAEEGEGDVLSEPVQAMFSTINLFKI